MILQERKQLDLDHPANEYLAKAKLTSPYWNPAEATVRRIAMQTAGLATYDRSYVQGLNQKRVPSEEIIRRYGIIFWRPGDHFDYSNLSYGILGEIVANVSKRSFGDFLKDAVLLVLGSGKVDVRKWNVVGALAHCAPLIAAFSSLNVFKEMGAFGVVWVPITFHLIFLSLETIAAVYPGGTK